MQTYEPNKIFVDFLLEDSENVILHYQDRTIIVKDISRQADGNLLGTIFGFEPPTTEFCGLKKDDRVEFTEDDVISASSRD